MGGEGGEGVGAGGGGGEVGGGGGGGGEGGYVGKMEGSERKRDRENQKKLMKTRNGISLPEQTYPTDIQGAPDSVWMPYPVLSDSSLLVWVVALYQGIVAGGSASG